MHARCIDVRSVLAVLGFASALLGLLVTFGAPAAKASAPSIQPLPSPTEFAGGVSISCTAPTDCTSIGDDGYWAMETNGVWVQEPDSPILDPMAVSCTDPKDCTVVGNDGGPVGVSQTETDGSWGAVTTIDPAGSFSVEGDALGGHEVSCTGAGDCTAIGQIGEPGTNYPAVVTETNGTWGSPVIYGPGSTLTTGTIDSAVSCSALGDCAVVGTYYDDDSTWQGFAVTESGGTWSSVVVDTITGYLDSPSLGFFYQPQSVSCVDASDCTSAGFTNSEGTSPTVVGESAGDWDSTTQITDTTGTGGELNGVSCVDATNCIAVGEDGTDGPTYAIETDGTWGTNTEVGSIGSDEDGFNDVSCTDALDCTAVALSGVDGFYSSTNTPTMSVTSNAPTYKQSLTFTATVTGSNTAKPKGPVTWNVTNPQTVPCTTTTGPIISSNVATYTCTITHAIAATYTATAVFSGDKNYAASSGVDQVTVAGGPPSISSFSPPSGAPGSKVTIMGSNLENAKQVTIGGTAAAVLSDTDTSIKVKVPQTAKTGTIKVKTPSGKATSSSSFTVT